MNFKSIKDLAVDIREQLIPKLPRNIGIVYGVARSGLLPASIIATTIGAKLGTAGDIARCGDRGEYCDSGSGMRVLIVDDSIYGGGAMRHAKSLLIGDNFLTCAVYASSKAIDKVDYYGMVLDGPRFFEWNFNGIKATEEFMFDMDGVICEDPKVYDDDGIKYQNEIKRVKPLYLPQVNIKVICTNRIERWRPETEEWLKNYNVRYDTLIMQPFDTAVERRIKSNPGIYKATHFKESTATVFIESHDWQAQKMSELVKKPILSIESMTLF